jgi:tetratricopeptide (TPR) repeat protein
MESHVVELPAWQKAWAWFEANKRQTLWGAGIILVVGVIIALVLYRRNEQEVAAGEALSSVSVAQMTGTSRGETADAYLKVAANYANSAAGARALLLAAGALFVEEKYAEAKTQFERFTREYNNSPFRGEALLGIAASLEAQGKATDAAAAYKNLIDRYPTDHVVPQARFALASLYEAQNKPEQARNLLEEVERNNPYSSLGSEAGMRLEELKVKYPNLAAPVLPAATNAVPTPTNAVPLQPQKR